MASQFSVQLEDGVSIDPIVPPTQQRSNGMKGVSKLVIILGLLAGGWCLAQGFQQEVIINMGEMFFQRTGQAQNETIMLETAVPYRLTFKNIGLTSHRVKFGRGLVVEEGVPFAYIENLFDNVPLKVQGGEEGSSFRMITDQLIELDLDPGEEIELLFTLPLEKSGSWELGCFVIGHYEAGMRTALVVQ